MEMRCLHPSLAWLAPAGFDTSSSRRLFFSPPSSSHLFKQVKIPCGKCIPCLINRKRKWIVRCAHEMEESASSWFVTLTYDGDNVPADGKLRPDHFTNFLKSLRRSLEPLRLRYFGCGEYGSESHRPHYHLCLFFENTIGSDVLQDTILRIWKRGFVRVDELCLGRIEYTAGYILKKLHPIRDLFGEEIYKPFFRCSQGLGRKTAEKYWSEYLANGGIRYKGKVYPIPEYYLNVAKECYGNDSTLFEYYARKMISLSKSGELSDDLECYFARAFEEKVNRAYDRSKLNAKSI